jgi:hypothetical protein
MGPWREIDGGRLVGVAIWESREAFLAAAPGIFAAVDNDPFDEWEAEPVVSLQLEEA